MTSRRCALGLAFFAALYAVVFGLLLPAFVDEAYTFALATDRSLRHVLEALRHGADGTQPLFGVLVFAWEKVFGRSELSLRLAGSIFVILFVWHSSLQLLRRFGPGIVGVAILLLLANERFIFYALQARYYGLLVFAFSLAFWSTWDLLETPGAAWARLLRHALFCGLLWLSHPLGMVYGTLLAGLYAAFAAWRRTFFLAQAAAFLGGPLCFLPWLPSFLIQRQINVAFPPGLALHGWHKYWEYAFLDSPVFCALSLLGVALFLARPRILSRPDDTPASLHARRDLTLFAFAFIVLLNVAVAALDAAGIIQIYLMLAVRYMLAVVVPFGVLYAVILDTFERLVRQHLDRPRAALALGLTHGLIALLLLGSLVRSGQMWWASKNDREPYLQRVAQLARDQRFDILCENHVDAFYLASRTPAPVVKYLLEDDYAYRAFLLAMYRYYPRPEPIGRAPFRSYGRDFVFVPASGTAGVVRAAAAVERTRRDSNPRPAD